MTDPIEITGLTKTFGTTRALDDLDLSVGSGEVHGFLGPNGAGKSTTIRILLGLIRPTSGRIRLLGGDPWTDAVELHRRLAYVPGDVTLWPNLTGGEIIDLLARLRGGIDVARRDELIERFELDPRKKARTYSTGNRQKVALVSALSSRADLLILDEPTSGLDPLMEVSVPEVPDRGEERRPHRRCCRATSCPRSRRLCDRVTIIRKGRTVETGTLARAAAPHPHTVEAELAAVAAGAAARLPTCTTSASTATGSVSRSTRHDSTQRSGCCTDAGVRGAHRHTAHPGGAVPAPLRGADRAG